MRIRKKLVFLHTCFSLALALVLLIALRPSLTHVVESAELDQAKRLLGLATPALAALGPPADDPLLRDLADRAVVRSGSQSELGIDSTTAMEAIASPGRAVGADLADMGPCAISYTPARAGVPEAFHALAMRIPEARAAVSTLYLLLVVALLAVYALVAIALEVFVLPQNVYAPIRRILAADRAIQEGRKNEEIIPPSSIPADELGEIMDSRNKAILQLRRQEAALAEALARLEQVANDLMRKNYLLETARRNLADADRLASLGMMSAGIAHELNTPLTVLKGLVEKLNSHPGSIDPPQAALMLRVVGRLERLGDSLLDFARARPPQSRPVTVQAIAQEAIMLVNLDREGRGVDVCNRVSERVALECDPDRMVQVLVNLIRNAVDAIRSVPGNSQERHAPGPSEAAVGRDATGYLSEAGDQLPVPGASRARVVVEAESSLKNGRDWVSVTITDEGPGIDPAILPHLFEPFVSSHLDARGTGLGLAVSDGIVREHGGVILARNRTDRPGAVFEIILPAAARSPAPGGPATAHEWAAAPERSGNP